MRMTNKRIGRIADGTHQTHGKNLRFRINVVARHVSGGDLASAPESMNGIPVLPPAEAATSRGQRTTGRTGFTGSILAGSRERERLSTHEKALHFRRAFEKPKSFSYAADLLLCRAALELR